MTHPATPAQSSQRIAVIPGDGIGHDVIEVARSVLDTAAARSDLALDYDTFDWSCRRYAETGAMMPDDAIDVLRGYDAILLGAV
ncbi:MAG: isocitrate/isopropylmalate family dehydrogenase, partial [Nocardioidaceae bacterium]